MDCPVYSREEMRAGDRLTGPAVVEQMDSTIVILPGWDARLEGTGILRLDSCTGGEA